MPPGPPSSSGAARHRAGGPTTGGLWDEECHSVPLLTELGRASRVGVTINMALLTELSPSPPLKIRIGCRAQRRGLIGTALAVNGLDRRRADVYDVQEQRGILAVPLASGSKARGVELVRSQLRAKYLLHLVDQDLARPARKSKRRFASLHLLGQFRSRGSSNAQVRAALRAQGEKDR